MKISVTLHAQADRFAEGGVSFHAFCHEDMSNCGYVACDTQTVEFDVPPRDVLIPGFVAAYRKEQQKIRAEAESKVNRLDEEIQKLLAIEDKS